MKQQTVCILFGGMSPEHEVSLRSAECILNNIDREKYHVVPVGITRAGQWLYYAGTDYRDDCSAAIRDSDGCFYDCEGIGHGNR